MDIAIIPARGGSKRIPRKNIKLFKGKPIIYWSIKNAIESNCFERIIVSTDDDEIAEVAKRYNAEVPFKRPKNLSDDYTSTKKVIKHCLSWLDKSNFAIDNVCCIYPTSAFIDKEDIKNAKNILDDSAEEILVFVGTPFHILFKEPYLLIQRDFQKCFILNTLIKELKI